MTIGRIPSVEGGIQPTIFDAKGDLIVATAADTPARLAVGANDLLVTADSSTSTGLKYSGAWTTWTPTLTNMSQGNGTITARYCKIGKVVTFYFLFELGSTSTVGTGPKFSLPFSTSHIRYSFPVFVLDSGVTNYWLSSTIDGAGAAVAIMDTRASGTYIEIPGGITATVPMTWANGDYMAVNGSYEVA